MTALCRCTHLRSAHQPTRRLCLGSPVCGCAEFRPDDGQRWRGERTHEQDNREDARRAGEFASPPADTSTGLLPPGYEPDPGDAL